MASARPVLNKSLNTRRRRDPNLGFVDELATGPSKASRRGSEAHTRVLVWSPNTHSIRLAAPETGPCWVTGAGDSPQAVDGHEQTAQEPTVSRVVIGRESSRAAARWSGLGIVYGAFPTRPLTRVFDNPERAGT